MKTQEAVAYGSLYLDEGETLKEAIEQIDRILNPKANNGIQPKVVALFFDVLGRPDQEIEGKLIAYRLKKYVGICRPHLDKVEIDFGTER